MRRWPRTPEELDMSLRLAISSADQFDDSYRSPTPNDEIRRRLRPRTRPRAKEITRATDSCMCQIR